MLFRSAVMAEEFNMSIVTAVLNGGEDYELLFTVPMEHYDKIAAMKGVGIVGHIGKAEHGLNLIGRQGEEIGLRAQGWNSLE